MGLDFKEIQYVCTKVPEEGELCKEMYFRAGKKAQRYFLGEEIDNSKYLAIRLTVYYERDIDDFAEVSLITSEEFNWQPVQMRHCDFYRLVEIGGGGFE